MRRLRRAMRQPDEGFTLMELLVAMVIITMVLVSLMMVQVSALVTSAQSRQRTLATSVSNQVMEELRALPYLVLSKGMHTGFQSAGADPNVAGGRLRPPSATGVDEVLVTDSSQAVDAAPLSGAGGTNVTRQTDPSIPGVEFLSRAYVSRNPATASGVLTLTVITSWTVRSTTKTQSVMLRSEAYAPQGGCGDNANMPFLGACQAIFSANGGSVAPATSVTPTAFDPVSGVAPAELLAGTIYASASITGGRTGVGVTSQQTSSADATVGLPGASFVQQDPAATALSTGGDQAVNQASNDVGAAGAAPANPADRTVLGAAPPVTLSAGGLTLRLRPASGVGGVAKSSMVASCAAGVPAGQGCAGATMTGGGATGAEMDVAGTTFGLAAIGAGGTASSFGGRMSSAAGSTAVGCTVLDGAGCVAAGTTRTIPSAQFGLGPWNGGAAPDGLVKVGAYADGVRVERGKLQPVPSAVTSRTATLQYWTGSGYSSVTVDRTSSGTYAGAPVTWTSGGWTVTAEATVSITSAMSIASNVDPVACTGEGCSIDADTGTLSVSVRWTATDGTTSTAFVSATNLGTSKANAAYKAAPDA